jgi:hypothetical protein
MLPKEINALRYFLPLVRLPLFRLFPFGKKSPKGSFFLLFAYGKLPFGDKKKQRKKKKAVSPFGGIEKKKKESLLFVPKKTVVVISPLRGYFLKKTLFF